MKTLRVAAIAAGLSAVLSFTVMAGGPKPAPLDKPKPHYTVLELPVASGADFLQPLRINNRGEILGYLDFSSGPYLDDPHAAIYRHGVVTDLHLLLPPTNVMQNSRAVALNDRGDAIFFSFGNSEGWEFHLYRNGRLQNLNALIGRNDIEVHAINNGGTIVGCTTVDNGYTDSQAFAYRHGQFRLLGLHADRPQSSAWAINERGAVVGWAGGNPDTNGLAVQFTGKSVVSVVPDESAIDINNRGDILCSRVLRLKNGVVEALSFDAEALNNRGEVVGSLNRFSNDSHAMLHARGKTEDLNSLIDPNAGWRLIYAYDINDRGQIVGWGRVNDNHWGGYVLTPKGKQR